MSEPTIPSGSKENVYVTSVTSSENFFCQLAKTSPQLDDLMNQIEEYYRPLGEDEEVYDDPQVGEACCAMFTEDDGWYRAVVTKVTGDTVRVCYSDYGNSEEIPLSRVKCLLPCFAEASAYGFQACLSSGGPVGTSDFSAAVGEKEFMVKVVARKDGGGYEVEVYEESGTRLFDSKQAVGKMDTSVTIKGTVENLV